MRCIIDRDDDGDFNDDAPQLVIPKDVEVFEISGPFFFGVASKFDEAERNLVKKPKIRIIRLRNVPFIDATGLNNLRNFIERAQIKQIQIILSGANKQVSDALKKSGLIEIVGEDQMCADINCALEKARIMLSKTKVRN